MSGSQKPRVAAFFPRMKVRGVRRRQRAWIWYWAGISLPHDWGSLGARLRGDHRAPTDRRNHGARPVTNSHAILELPWTAPPLSLNDRGAWAPRARKIADVRATALTLACAVRLPHFVEHATIQLHYRPRDNRRRDTDNLVATLKPICDALTIGRAAGRTRTGKPIAPQYGYGLVLDDTPRYMAKPEPIIHRAEKGQPGAMWLEITWINPAVDMAQPAQEQ